MLIRFLTPTHFFGGKIVVTCNMEKANLNSTLIIFHDLRGVVLRGADGLSMIIFVYVDIHHNHNIHIQIHTSSVFGTAVLEHVKPRGAAEILCAFWLQSPYSFGESGPQHIGIPEVA